MSKITNAVLGLVAGALALGAVHLEHASSRTLPALPPSDAMLRAVSPLHDINRTGKADRLGAPQAADGASTFIVYPVSAPDMLIVARINRKAPVPVKKPPRKESSSDMKIACEPLMSPLAAAAEETAPGRCMV